MNRKNGPGGWSPYRQQGFKSQREALGAAPQNSKAAESDKPSDWAIDTGIGAGSVATLALLANLKGEDAEWSTFLPWPMAMLAIAAVLALFALLLHVASKILDEDLRGNLREIRSQKIPRWLPTFQPLTAKASRKKGWLHGSVVVISLIPAALSVWIGSSAGWFVAILILIPLLPVIYALDRGYGDYAAEVVRMCAFILLLLGAGSAFTIKAVQEATSPIDPQEEAQARPGSFTMNIVRGGDTGGTEEVTFMQDGTPVVRECPSCTAPPCPPCPPVCERPQGKPYDVQQDAICTACTICAEAQN